MRAGDVLADLGRPIVLHANLIRALGSWPAAAMLAQLLYWTGKEADGEGWIHKVEADWDEELAFSPQRLKTSRSLLVDLGIVEHTRRGLPALPCYRVKMDGLEAWWTTHFPPAEPDQSDHRDPALSGCQQPDSAGAQQPDIPLFIDDYRDATSRAGKSDPLERFAKFWDAYPPRNGKKVGRAQTKARFMKLTYEEQRAAWIGAHYLAEAITAGGKFGPPDPDRWLRDRKWEDWQEPAVVPDPHEVTYSSAYSR